MQSNLFWTHVFLLSVLWAIPNHFSLKYRIHFTENRNAKKKIKIKNYIPTTDSFTSTRIWNTKMDYTIWDSERQ